jgi:glycine oxidase
MLAAQVEAGPDDPLFNLALSGRAFYHREVPTLEADTGIKIGHLETGILQIASDETVATLLRSKVAWQRQQGQHADWFRPDEIAEGWPWLNPGLGGLWAGSDGVLDPRALVAALLADAKAHGARIIADHATGLLVDHGQLRGVVGIQSNYHSERVVVTNGAWARSLANLPRPLSVEPVRGQIVAFRAPDGIAPGVVYGDHCYLLVRNGELLAGSTMDHAGFDASTSDAAATAIIARCTLLFPGLAALQPLRTWAGLRPGTPDGAPIIGPEPRMPGLWYATGHGRNGVLLAGITGELIAQSVDGQPLPDELSLARPERFWNW